MSKWTHVQYTTFYVTDNISNEGSDILKAYQLKMKIMPHERSFVLFRKMDITTKIQHPVKFETMLDLVHTHKICL